MICRKRVLGLVVVLATVAASAGACSRGDAAPGAAARPAPASVSGELAASEAVATPARADNLAAGSSPEPPAEVSAGEGAEAAGTGRDMPAPAGGADAALSAVVMPSCISPGDAFEVRISSEARAGFALAVAYADDQAHGAMGFGDADDAGVFVWSLVAAADVPVGPATVLIGARPEGGGPATSIKVPFSVVERVGCR